VQQLLQGMDPVLRKFIVRNAAHFFDPPLHAPEHSPEPSFIRPRLYAPAASPEGHDADSSSNGDDAPTYGSRASTSIKKRYAQPPQVRACVPR
jgi:hypothetical protein